MRHSPPGRVGADDCRVGLGYTADLLVDAGKAPLTGVRILTAHDEPKPKKEGAFSGALERFLFSRIVGWVVLLVLLLGCLLTIGFGAAVLDAERKEGRYGAASRAAVTVAEVPRKFKQMLNPGGSLLGYSNHLYNSKRGGWSFPSGPTNGLHGFLLLSRHDGDENRSKIELVSLSTMQRVRSWSLSTAELSEYVTHRPRQFDGSWLRVVHPWIDDSGDLIVKDHYSPLVRIDSCGKRIWTLQNAVYHHSTETDADGNLWIPSIAERSKIAHVSDDFQDDLISEVSPSGKLLFARSVPEILIRHGFANWLFTSGMNSVDPTHLNDIEPVLADGPFWEKGDLFLSLRNVSAVMLYRPSTDEIVWIKRGPWVSQHDVDVLDDHRIGVYDNGVQHRGREPFFPGTSQVTVYDFASGKISMPLKEAMKSSRVRTIEEGLFTSLPGAFTLVEDTVDGRMVIFRHTGEVAAEYVNRARNGKIYHLSWSRYIERAKGDIILRNLRKVKCDA